METFATASRTGCLRPLAGLSAGLPAAAEDGLSTDLVLVGSAGLVGSVEVSVEVDSVEVDSVDVGSVEVSVEEDSVEADSVELSAELSVEVDSDLVWATASLAETADRDATAGALGAATLATDGTWT